MCEELCPPTDPRVSSGRIERPLPKLPCGALGFFCDPQAKRFSFRASDLKHVITSRSWVGGGADFFFPAAFVRRGPLPDVRWSLLDTGRPPTSATHHRPNHHPPFGPPPGDGRRPPVRHIAQKLSTETVSKRPSHSTRKAQDRLLSDRRRARVPTSFPRQPASCSPWPRPRTARTKSPLDHAYAPSTRLAELSSQQLYGAFFRTRRA